MKTWGVISLALVFLLSAVAVGQEVTQANKAQTTPRKTISVTGRMSDDGRVLLRDADSKTWTVNNPDALQGYAGREVVIRCQVLPEGSEVHVVSVKPVNGETAYATKWGDPAFRR